MLSRRVDYSLNYAGVNITEDIKRFTEAITFTEVASGESDSLSLTLNNEDKIWIKDWKPSKGDKISCDLNTINWHYEGDFESLSLGTFSVDSVLPSAPPNIVELGGVSAPVETDFLTQGRSKSFEYASVKEIATSIANRYALDLIFDTAFDFRIPAIEQKDQSDSSFLLDICKKYGYSIKIYNEQIVIFRQSEYEQKDANVTLEEGKDFMSWSMEDILTNTSYKNAVIKYKDANGDEFNYKFSIGKGKTLFINEVVDSYAEAQVVAKARMREENIKENTIGIELMLDLRLYACKTINIKNIGQYDGKYYIDSLSHSIAGGSSSSISCHKVLEGDY